MRRSKLIMCGKVMGIAFKGGIASHSASTFLWHLDDLDVFNLKTLTKRSRMNGLLLCVFEHAPSYGIYLALSAFVWRALPSRNCTYIHTYTHALEIWKVEREEWVELVDALKRFPKCIVEHTLAKNWFKSLLWTHAWTNSVITHLKHRREGDRKKREEGREKQRVRGGDQPPFPTHGNRPKVLYAPAEDRSFTSFQMFHTHTHPFPVWGTGYLSGGWASPGVSLGYRRSYRQELDVNFQNQSWIFEELNCSFHDHDTVITVGEKLRCDKRNCISHSI